MVGFRGTFVVSWSQTEIDGLKSGPVSALEVGATWRWSGAPVRVDGPNDVLVLCGPDGEQELRKRAARVVRRLLGPAFAVPLWEDLHGDEPLFERFFSVTDGRKTYSITLIDLAQTARPLLLFLGDLPPKDQDLWVTECLDQGKRAAPTLRTDPGVICFAKGTLLRTPTGPKAVETLAPGDLIETRDAGAQPVVWVGHRRVSGARLHALPTLRPIRLRTGALGFEQPSPDLIVSPQHRILVRGAMAEALFNTDEVLVAACDMVNDRTVTVEHSAREVVYYHVMLPAHHLVWANGVACDTFHPAHAPLDALPDEQRRTLTAADPQSAHDPFSFGEPARRMLSNGEAAILMHEAKGRRRAVS